jgi:hypothetical protein
MDVSNDWMVFDNTETIVFANIGAASITIPRVVRRSSSMVVSDGGGALVYGADVTFIIFRVNVPGGFAPRVNARITDAHGRSYRVDSINDGVLRTRWLVNCTSEAGQGLAPQGS